jgi:NADPH2:quinone reductase
LIEIYFSGVNPSDAKARGGNRPGLKKPVFEQVIPHSDGSGIIADVGQGVSKKRLGERVWIWNGQWQRAFGTAAEFIALPSEQAVEMPDGMSFESGACMGIPGLTASHCTLGKGSINGKTVLVSGGAGAVGHNAIQLAKWAGATVISTGSRNRFKHIKSAGADSVIDYNDTKIVEKILKACPLGVDLAVEVEFGENIDILHQVVKANGTISVYGSAKNMSPKFLFAPYLFKALKIDVSLIYILSDTLRKKSIEFLHKAHKDRAFKPIVHKVFELTDCAYAHDISLTPGRTGAILLKVKEE